MKISLVTISYNQAKFLPSLLSSVKRELDTGDEHIIVDAGSTDSSRLLIAESVATDSRIKLIFESDRGPADGLNKGFSFAGGDIFGYINSDDFLLPSALRFVRSYFDRNSHVDVLLGSIKMADASGIIARRGRVPDWPSARRLAAGVCQYYQQGTFFRRNAFQRTNGFNLDNRTCWDRELMVDLAIAKAEFRVVSRPLGAFRLHTQSITGGGLNSKAYLADSRRIEQKAKLAFGGTPSSALTKWLKFESRFNPWRVVRQLRPVPSL